MKLLTQKIVFTLCLFMALRESAIASNHNLINDSFESAIGVQNLEYSYKVSENWTFGITGTSTSGHVKVKDMELKGSSFGGIARYYFEPAFQNDSWYLVTAANKFDYEASIISNGTRYSGKAKDSLAAGGGFHWFWNSFNTNLGLLISNQPEIKLRDVSGQKYKERFNANLGFEFKMGGKF
jgi:hypothetical protein